MLKPHIKIPFVLQDEENIENLENETAENLNEIDFTNYGHIVQEDICSGLDISLLGYGDYSSVKGEGVIIRLEKSNGKVRLLVWADINKEDPTHIISLEKAKYDN